jgi:hypothetical protein
MKGEVKNNKKVCEEFYSPSNPIRLEIFLNLNNLRTQPWHLSVVQYAAPDEIYPLNAEYWGGIHGL